MSSTTDDDGDLGDVDEGTAHAVATFRYEGPPSPDDVEYTRTRLSNWRETNRKLAALDPHALGEAFPSDQLVKAYLENRKQRQRVEAHVKAFLADITAAQDVLEAAMLAKLDKDGSENARTKEGTAYKSVLTSITLENKDEYLRHVIAEGAWELLEIRAAKKACTEYIETHKTIPPGAKVATVIKVNFRSPSNKD